MSKKYLIENAQDFGGMILHVDKSDAKQVEVMDYQKTKREYEDSIFLSFIDFVRSKNYLIVKIIE